MTKEDLLEIIKKVDEILAYADPYNPESEGDALEAYDWITAIVDARAILKEALER